MPELVYPPYPAVVLPLPTADNPGEERPAGVEMVPVVLPGGEVIGQAARSYVHGGSRLLHPTVHLHVMNRYAQLYLQKRARTKDLYPGYWDTAVGGHVGYGEYVSEALYREAAEELGLTRFNPVFLTSYVFECTAEREWINTFACVGRFEPRPDPEEVETGRWWAMDEIASRLGQSVFTPNFEEEFVRIRQDLEALL